MGVAQYSLSGRIDVENWMRISSENWTTQVQSRCMGSGSDDIHQFSLSFFVFLILTFKLGRHIAPRLIFICFFSPVLEIL
jgi:hypothetical protein